MAETTAHKGFECDPATQRAKWNDNFIQLTNTNRKMFQFICCEMGPRVGKSEQMRAMRNMLKMKIGFYHRQKMQTKGRASRIVFALVRVCVCVVRACWVGVISFHLFGSLPELAAKSTIMFFQITIYIYLFYIFQFS